MAAPPAESRTPAWVREALGLVVAAAVAIATTAIVASSTRVELLLRISFRNPAAVVDLSRKFGCEPAAVPSLLEMAADLGLSVRGLTFHVGSQVADPGKYVEAIAACRDLIADATTRGHTGLDCLDIGGGFPVAYRRDPLPIRRFCQPIRRALARLPPDIRVIAEPGRFIAAPAGTAVASVIGRAQREGRRRYITQLTRRRLHQESFRWRVLRAYQERCAICRLRHTELLDAAHILPDGHPRGEPVLPNGLALCRLHHGAFDAHILGIRPDLVIDVRKEVRDEADGPMLRHGLQGFHGESIHVPRPAELKPSTEFLAMRDDLFRNAG